MSTRKYTIRLFPTPSQEAMFWQYAGARRYVWNWGLATIKQWHEDGEKLDWNRLARELTALKGEVGNEWMGDLNSHAFRSPLRDLKTAMQSFFRRVKQGETPGFPRFKRRYQGTQGFWCPDACCTEDQRITFMRNRIKMARPVPVEGEIGISVRFKHTANRWYASFTVTIPNVDIEPVEPENLVGVDIGIRKYAALSDGTIIENPRWSRRYARKLAHWQRKLARQKRGSERRDRIKTRIAKIHAAIANRRKHYSHLISKQIAVNYDAACIESHSLKDQMPKKIRGKKNRLPKYLADVGHGHFRECLEYKLPDRGKVLVKADKHFPSSKTCSACGLVLVELSKAENWTCPRCDTRHDRDFNAAVNLQREGVKQVTTDQL